MCSRHGERRARLQAGGVTAQWVAACGIDCETCCIRRILFDEEAVKTCIEWFRSLEWLREDERVETALDRGMYCRGCKAERSVHWSVDDGQVDCFILDCCVDKKELEFCSHCNEFPCNRLREWSEENDRYAAAFARLEAMRAQATEEGRIADHE